MRFSEILGQDRPVKIIKSAISSGDISQAYLFSGPEGIGKRLAASNLAMALNCLSPDGDSCGKCVNCAKFQNGNFPDFFAVEPEDGTIKISAMRELQKKISYRPYEGRYKVVIVESAEDMTTGAANSFLKTLEEPPDVTIFILISHNFNLLLPTIISRCQRIQFNLIPQETIKNILVEKNHMTPENARLTASYSQGCLGKAIEMDMESFVETRNEILGLMENISFRDIDLIFDKSKEWSSDSENVKFIFSTILNIARDLAVLKAGESEKLIMNLDAKDKLLSLIKAASLNQLIKLFYIAQEGVNNLKRNANARLLLEIVLINICSVFEEN